MPACLPKQKRDFLLSGTDSIIELKQKEITKLKDGIEGITEEQAQSKINENLSIINSAKITKTTLENTDEC